MRIDGKVVLITGASEGIGAACAAAFRKRGARLSLIARSPEKLRAAGGPGAIVTPGDLTVPEIRQAAVAATLDRFGAIDILINNAGITRDATLLKMTPEQWNQVIDVNLSGVFHCTKHVAPHMVERGRGKIINTSSIVGLFGNFGQTNYAATKAGLIGMTKTWARELGPKGITVNAVAPGFIATEMVKKMPEKVLQGMRDRTPVRRLGEPRDVANAYLFLASDEADFINGAVLSVDGGLTL